MVVYKVASIDPWPDCPLEKLVRLDGPSWWNLQAFDVPERDVRGQL